MNLMLRWTNTKLPLIFRDDVISLTGPYPFRGAWQDRLKRKRFPGQKSPLSPARAGLFYVYCVSAYLCCMKTHEFQAPKSGSKGQQRPGPEPLMQVHENRYMKCPSVTGLRVRACLLNHSSLKF